MKTLIIKLKFTLPLISIYFFASFLAEETPVTIAVAANAQYAMKDIEKQYEQETGKQINLIISSSGKLTAQIKQNAPYDIFLSADMDFPNQLHKEGLCIYSPKVYAYGSLVLWSLTIEEGLVMNSLKLNSVKSIAIANPKLAPYGEAAVQVLKYYKLYDTVKTKLVYGESISQVNQYITTKTVSVGFTAKSVVMSPEMQGKGKWIDIDKKTYTPIEQGAVLLKSSTTRNKADAESFYSYLFSAKAQTILKKYGYQFTK